MPRVEDHIRKAEEAGEFDNLPGKGKPLQLEDDSLVDPEWRLAHHILKTSGFSLPWIEERKELIAQIEAIRAALRRSWAWRAESLAASRPYDLVQVEWQRAVAVFQDQANEVNTRLRFFNLTVPAERFHLPLIQVENELQALSQK